MSIDKAVVPARRRRSRAPWAGLAAVALALAATLGSGGAAHAASSADVGVDVGLMSGQTLSVGAQVTLVVALGNNGPDVPGIVDLLVTLPADMSFDYSTEVNAAGIYDSGDGIWTVVNPAVGVSTLLITATITSAAPGAFNGEILDSDAEDPNPANNISTTLIRPLQADLALTSAVSNQAPSVGDTVTVTVTLSDQGPDDDADVTVASLLPGGLTFVSAVPSQGTYASATGVWNVGTVTASTPQALEITARVDSAAQQTATASISQADQYDPNTANNTSSVTITRGRRWASR